MPEFFQSRMFTCMAYSIILLPHLQELLTSFRLDQELSMYQCLIGKQKVLHESKYSPALRISLNSLAFTALCSKRFLICLILITVPHTFLSLMHEKLYPSNMHCLIYPCYSGFLIIAYLLAASSPSLNAPLCANLPHGCKSHMRPCIFMWKVLTDHQKLSANAVFTESQY